MASSWPSRAHREETTAAPSSYCTIRGCSQVVYAGGTCSAHWERPPQVTCGHAVPVVLCGCCRRYVCSDCYGEWNALACGDCRAKARRRAS